MQNYKVPKDQQIFPSLDFQPNTLDSKRMNYASEVLNQANTVTEQPIKLQLRKQNFRIRASLLDYYSATFQESPLWGVLNYINMIGFIYIIINCVNEFYTTGKLFQTRFYYLILGDLPLCLSLWIIVIIFIEHKNTKYYIWSHLALLLQMALVANLNKFIFFICHTIFCLGPLVCSAMLAIYRDWCTTQGFFASMQACVFMMKIHSYGITNYHLMVESKQSEKPQEKNPSVYPNNINFENFTKFLWSPTLVYQINYPEQRGIRIGYLIHKAFYTFYLLVLLYQVISYQVYPIFDNFHDLSPIKGVIQLMFPIGIIFFALFYIIFEQILNFFAEISQFGDRLFYGTWWNCSGFKDFNRLWNIPVHLFLKQHVFLAIYDHSEKGAYILTYIITAALHEYCIAVALRMFRPVFFCLCLLQIPMTLCKCDYFSRFISNHYHFFSIFFGNALMIYIYVYLKNLNE